MKISIVWGAHGPILFLTLTNSGTPYFRIESHIDGGDGSVINAFPYVDVAVLTISIFDLQILATHIRFSLLVCRTVTCLHKVLI